MFSRLSRYLLIGAFSIICVVLSTLLGIAVWRRLNERPVLLSPLSRLSYLQSIGQAPLSGDKRVYGFLPYWNLKTASVSSTLTDVAYFSVGLDGNGKLVERDADGNAETGLRRLQEESFTSWIDERHHEGQRVHVTITVFQPDTIRALVSNPNSRREARHTIGQLVASYPFDGVQLDVEFAGTVDDSIRDDYVDFVHELHDELHRIDPHIELSVALFASAASRYTFWDVAKLQPWCDFFIVMAYDYHVRSSGTVGPVAPIFGKGTGRWEDDVVSNMRDLLKVAPTDKLMLGIPFYGYEWTSTSDSMGANTFPESGETATYKRVQEILEDPKLSAKERWDEDALSPYVTYKEKGQTQFIYYENTRSLSYKLDFVQQLNLKGIAIWALGYEGGRQELWQTIQQKLRTQSPTPSP